MKAWPDMPDSPDVVWGDPLYFAYGIQIHKITYSSQKGYAITTGDSSGSRTEFFSELETVLRLMNKIYRGSKFKEAFFPEKFCGIVIPNAEVK